MILPDLNHIIFDSWGHYVGHSIWLPLKINDYKELQQQESFESYLTPDKISNCVATREGAILNYSLYTASLNVSQCQIMNAGRYLAKVEQKERYLVAAYSAMEEAHELLSNMDMKVVGSYKHTNSEVCNKLYEVKLDVLMRSNGPWKWLVEKGNKKLYRNS